MSDWSLRSHGVRDLGPGEMERFRRIERAFLEQISASGYREIRTPTIEPLHLYTAAGALSPQALDRVYSFLDWDGWSGERVVLRPDSTVPAARWYVEQAPNHVERIAYVQPAYRFAANGDREVWQCGVELFGAPAPEGDAELLTIARKFLATLGVKGLSVELAHTGMARSVLTGVGLDPEAQIDTYDRILGGDTSVAAELAEVYPQCAAALRLLFETHGTTVGYVGNLRAAMLSVAPDAAPHLDELEVAARALDDARLPYRVLPATAGSFEYYTGVTFRMLSHGRECVTGGRYDGLVETIGGKSTPAAGWGANVSHLSEIAD